MNTELENLQTQFSTAYAGFFQIAAGFDPPDDIDTFNAKSISE